MSRHDPMAAGVSSPLAHSATGSQAGAPGYPPGAEAEVAGRVGDLVAAGDHAGARELFGHIVTRQQRRASRIAWHYLRDAAEADEAVQDAFVKAFTHIESFQRELSFEVWFTRILINGCLDRRKVQSRRARWLVSAADVGQHDQATFERASRPLDRSPEEMLIAREWRHRLAAAVRRLPGRQRLVFLLCHYEEHSTRDVAEMIGLNESTVRVHLFRAVRKLRTAMEERRHASR